MRALQQKQARENNLKQQQDNFKSDTVEDRIERLTRVHNNEREQIFAILYTTVHKAATDGNVSAVAHFIEGPNPENVNGFDKNGMAPIHLACERGHNFVLKFLAEHGADTNLKSARDDATPLMLACKEGMTETVKMLISLGALLLLRNRSGHTALHYATQGDHLGCIQPICEAHTSLRKAWLIALANGGKVDDETGEMFRQYNRLSSVTKLLKKHSGSGVGVKAAQRPPSSASAQHEAEDTPAAKEVNDEADFLHSEKDLIEAPCNNRMQPLHMACHYNACNVVQYLLDCGADASALDAVGETPLHKAARGGYRTIYHLLVTAGADETVHSKLRDTPRQLLYDESSF